MPTPEYGYREGVWRSEVEMRRWAMGIGLVSALACGGDMSDLEPKPLPADKLDYAGHWTSGTGVDLTITPDGMADWRRADGSGFDSSISAPITEWTDAGFKVGIGFLTTEFVVDAPPAETDGTWTMTVDGVELSRDLGIEEEPPLVIPPG